MELYDSATACFGGCALFGSNIGLGSECPKFACHIPFWCCTKGNLKNIKRHALTKSFLIVRQIIHQMTHGINCWRMITDEGTNFLASTSINFDGIEPPFLLHLRCLVYIPIAWKLRLVVRKRKHGHRQRHGQRNKQRHWHLLGRVRVVGDRSLLEIHAIHLWLQINTADLWSTRQRQGWAPVVGLTGNCSLV